MKMVDKMVTHYSFSVLEHKQHLKQSFYEEIFHFAKFMSI